jgi:peroxiredoxin Q/BCP
LLSDPGGHFAASIGALSLIGRAQRWTYYIGKDGTLLHVDKDVSVRSHGRDIAVKLGELGVAKRP